MHHLAVEWHIEGDLNTNGKVDVRYRAVGEKTWAPALPLRRVPAGQSVGTTPIFRWRNKHSGSVFDLKPDTEYEIHLKLVDPDGGSAERTVRARTRAIPKPMADAPVRRVTPDTLKAVLAAARPGEVVLLGEGEYGRVDVPAGGEAGRPLVVRGDGRAVCRGVYVRQCKHVIVEKLTVHGPIDLQGSSDCGVRYCRVHVQGKGFGIGTRGRPGATNCYIADNIVTGRTPWASEAMGASGENAGEGIQITGPGNVICYNRVDSLRDCISTMEDRGTGLQVCIDIYNNDVRFAADDGIEADFCMHNCRILRNRLTNCFMGLSSQPGLGGPTYFIRNVMYNLTHAPFKLHRHSTGDVCLHNTVVKVGDGMACFTYETFDRAYFRNNLCIGGPTGGAWYGKYRPGRGLAVYMRAAGPNCDFDYDALGSHTLPLRGQIGKQSFDDLAGLRRGPHERHAVEAGMSVFADVPFPAKPIPGYDPPDLRPRPGSVVVDKGQRLPNVNDAFRGQGPDMGAYEAGQDLPHYGPRSSGA
ncbi:MAG: hypothetical protein AMK72_07680 [Planctomycetes bacterium SM23_25]|nr:MAG: hypothetical protein AMK72_07680 [Planctomycetes bacterium SM23_25]